MTDTTWPDPARPGVPLNSERDGWHWVLVAHGVGHPFPMLWAADGRMWDAGDAGWVLAEDIAPRWRYLGPCLTPAEVAARVAAAVDAYKTEWVEEPPGAIQKHGIEFLSPELVAAREAAARKAGLRKAAEWHKGQVVYLQTRTQQRLAEGQCAASDVLKLVQAAHKNSAAAILALAEKDTAHE
jgi:hypothetical protein